MVAPTTVVPGPLLTGIDSPVSMDSSTSESPVCTVPSTGILLPGRIRGERFKAESDHVPVLSDWSDDSSELVIANLKKMSD